MASSVAQSATNVAARCSRMASFDGVRRLLHDLLEVLRASARAQRAQQHEALAPRPSARRGWTTGCSPERATARHCIHAHGASDSLSAVSSVVSQPREPALVTRVRMARSDCDDLEQHRGRGACAPHSALRCSRWLMLATVYRSGDGTIKSRTRSSVAGWPPSRSWMHPRYSARADVHTAAQ